MVIIKKQGNREEYSSAKLSASLRLANQGTGEEIDIATLVYEFYTIVEEKTFITTKQIDVIICGILYTHGLFKTLDSFISYDEKNKE